MRIVIELTNRCNLACQHCFSGRHGGHDDLPLDVVERILEEAKTLNFRHLTFTGGDPTVYKYFDELLARVAAHGYRFSFVTNGYNFASSHKKILPYLASLEQITFSLDGATEATHGALRGQHSFKKVLEAMTLCREKNIPFTNNMVVTKHNRHELRDVANLTHARGSSGLRFGHLMHSPLTTAQGFDLTPDERQGVESDIWKLQLEYKNILPIAMAPGFSTQELFPCAPLHLQEFNIDYLGNVTKCCHLSSHGSLASQDDIVGNLSELSLREGLTRLLAANERFRRSKKERTQQGLNTSDALPCWYCANYFKKIDWLETFPDHAWLPHVWPK